jgi:hypothetical protein
MTFEVRPYPEFAWSISRQRRLDQCPRAHFYTHHLGWNGWLDDAPTQTRVAYRLGKLTSLDALLGQQTDMRARELEAAARGGGAQMRALLADPEQNIPLEMASFERHESGLCRSCNFLPVCA